MHPREWNRDVQFRGRVRVQLKQADGNLCLDKFNSRESCVNIMSQYFEPLNRLLTRSVLPEFTGRVPTDGVGHFADYDKTSLCFLLMQVKM